MQDIFAAMYNWMLVNVSSPPGSAVFVLIVSVSISTISNMAMRRFTDMRRLNRYQTEIKQYREMEQQAKKTGNEKLLRKVRRRKSYVDRIQREMLTARCKPMMFFFIPFILLFNVLRTFYLEADGITQTIVAILPFNANKLLPFLEGFIGVQTAAGFGLWFWPFYFLVGLGLGQILQRIQGVQIMTT
ncbi:MAG: DUF106 domain-containing protein [Candidatus Thorarchaeota archaeon]|nr:MAG: DUF106 domain-containing protein [Candidatus Thorarchaeota archaeon]